jgi:uncharacterized protein (DUF305 family)
MDNEMKKGNYKKFILMLFISFCVMYAVMFFNVDKADHIYLSTTRLYMSLLMVTPMALLMLTLMRKMYPDKKTNTVIILSSVVIFILSLTFLRTQTPIADREYMKAMIPHHSSAILTSKHADIKDPEVKKLAKKIIQSQEEEIAQMKAILERMDNE